LENKNGNACCAKVNRNYQGNATSNRPLIAAPSTRLRAFNVYADWAQKQCPYIYAFAYDDVADQSGFFTCNQGTEMDVTYCRATEVAPTVGLPPPCSARSLARGRSGRCARNGGRPSRG